MLPVCTTSHLAVLNIAFSRFLDVYTRTDAIMLQLIPREKEPYEASHS
jgi:hypothetical protein